MTNVALIPARKGSQRLPHKNLMELCGKPLIAWTIEAAIESKKFSSVVVSTDSPEIEAISREYGAEVIRRPESISQNASPSREVVLHFLDFNEGFERVAFLQPTSPLRTAQHISEAVDLSISSGAKSVAACHLLKAGLSWSLCSNQDESLSAGTRNPYMVSENQSIAVLNGSIYLLEPAAFRKSKAFVSSGTIPYFMDEWDSIDIDFPEDWNMANHRLANRISRHAEGGEQ